MKKPLLIAIIFLLVAGGSGFTWMWTSYDNTGQFPFTFSGTDSVQIVNVPPNSDSPSRLEVEVGHEFDLNLEFDDGYW